MADNTEFIATQLQYFYKKAKGRCPANMDVHFYRAARLCNQLGATPEIFVEAQVKYNKMFYPSSMYGAVARKCYGDYICNKNVSYDSSYEYYKRIVLDMLVSRKLSLEKILLDRELPLAAWFRVSASVEPMPTVMRRFLGEAKEEYCQGLKSFMTRNSLAYERIER